jgi:SPX domain protein involved in polyphosphate accumulation
VNPAPTAHTLPDADRPGPRAFNRFELKYLADRRLVDALRAELRARLTPDAHGVDGFYPVWSCYYDTVGLRFYWEKLDGLRVRRKLRIRHYGEPAALTLDGRVWVEIKQRVDRVTQKRRIALPYREALNLCAGEELRNLANAEKPTADEVRALVHGLALQPTAIIGYVREAFMGDESDPGLRVTVDSRLRGRDRDLDLRLETENRYIVHHEFSVVEVKVNERVPYWFAEAAARHNLRLIRVSKYCQGVEAFGQVPRSIFHIPETVDGAEA